MLAKKISYDSYDYADYKEHVIRENVQKEKAQEVCNTSLRRQVAMIVGMTLMFAFWMAMRSDVFIQNGYELVAMKKQEAEAIKTIEYMQVGLSKLKSPERIAAMAAKIGMVPADKNLYVTAQGAVTPEAEKGLAEKSRTVWNKE